MFGERQAGKFSVTRCGISRVSQQTLLTLYDFVDLVLSPPLRLLFLSQCCRVGLHQHGVTQLGWKTVQTTTEHAGFEVKAMLSGVEPPELLQNLPSEGARGVGKSLFPITRPTPRFWIIISRKMNCLMMLNPCLKNGLRASWTSGNQVVKMTTYLLKAVLSVSLSQSVLFYQEPVGSHVSKQMFCSGAFLGWWTAVRAADGVSAQGPFLPGSGEGKAKENQRLRPEELFCHDDDGEIRRCRSHGVVLALSSRAFKSFVAYKPGYFPLAVRRVCRRPCFWAFTLKETTKKQSIKCRAKTSSEVKRSEGGHTVLCVNVSHVQHTVQPAWVVFLALLLNFWILLLRTNRINNSRTDSLARDGKCRWF